MLRVSKACSSPAPHPTPHVVLPTIEHSHTIILLHGRGSNGSEFAEELFEGRTTSERSLAEHFPSWKWVFPTARDGYSTVFQENMTEWFDMYSLSDPSRCEELQVDGLKYSVESILRLMEEEKTKVISPDRLILGGISQGCATGIHVMLAGSHRLGAYLGFCGWIPFRAQVQDLARGESAARKMSCLADFYQSTLDLTPLAPAVGCAERVFGTPVFLSHASDDDVVDSSLGKDIRVTLEKLGMSVVWKEYEVGGHWIKEPVGFDHLVAFLQRVVEDQSTNTLI